MGTRVVVVKFWTYNSVLNIVYAGTVRCGAVRCGPVRCGTVRYGAVRR